MKRRNSNKHSLAASMSFSTSDKVFALNPKYKDGSRLRAHATDASLFNGVWCPNDTPLQILEIDGDFCLVKKPDGQTGWIRNRNLTKQQRVAGVVKGKISRQVKNQILNLKLWIFLKLDGIQMTACLDILPNNICINPYIFSFEFITIF